MKKGRAMIWSAALAAASWAGSASAGIVVTTSRPDITLNFWIARNADFQREMAQRRGNLREVLELYGLRPINGRPLRTKANVGYIVFPECGGQPKPPGMRADGERDRPEVHC